MRLPKEPGPQPPSGTAATATAKTTVDVTEKSFEATIEQVLTQPFSEPAAPGSANGNTQVAGGYRKRSPGDYERKLCLDPEAVFDFVYATQPKEWEKLKAQYGTEVKARFLKRLASEVAKQGTLNVLRRGIKDSGCTFRLAHFRPASGLNTETQKLYQANQFSITRQLHYSEKNENSLDMSLFLNGLPIFTSELKNPFTGQTVLDAVAQYKHDRDRRNRSFSSAGASVTSPSTLTWFTSRPSWKGRRPGSCHSIAASTAAPGTSRAPPTSPPRTCGNRSGAATACST